MIVFSGTLIVSLTTAGYGRGSSRRRRHHPRRRAVLVILVLSFVSRLGVVGLLKGRWSLLWHALGDSPLGITKLTKHL